MHVAIITPFTDFHPCKNITSSAANFKTAVNGVPSGTLNLKQIDTYQKVTMDVSYVTIKCI